MSEPKVFVFDKKEIFVFLVVFICINILFFALGVKVGQMNPGEQSSVEDHAVNEKSESKGHATGETSDPASHTEEHSHDQKDISHEEKKEVPPSAHKEEEVAKSAGEAESAHEKVVVEEVKKTAPIGFAETVDPKPKDKKANWKEPFYIQIGSFTDETDAKTMQSNLKKDGVHTYIIKANVGGVNRYRVAFGDFSSRQAALKDIKRLQDLTGIEPALQKRD